MNLSMTTDFAADQGCPEEALRTIARHGFTHVHWCHQWDTDFLYADCEIDQILCWLTGLGLGVTDLHASDGREKRWVSPREYERRAGVELVRNRIHMAARLGADVIIMHMGTAPVDAEGAARYWDQLWRSLDELEPYARDRQVRIAIENGIFAQIRRVFSRYPADYVGLCYDCGHGNISGDGLDETEALGDRLISLHLHDNNGERDLHQPLFMGTVDWERLAGVIARSGYTKWVNLETSIRNSGTDDHDSLMDMAYRAGTRFAGMIEKARATA